MTTIVPGSALAPNLRATAMWAADGRLELAPEVSERVVRLAIRLAAVLDKFAEQGRANNEDDWFWEARCAACHVMAICHAARLGVTHVCVLVDSLRGGETAASTLEEHLSPSAL